LSCDVEVSMSYNIFVNPFDP